MVIDYLSLSYADRNPIIATSRQFASLHPGASTMTQQPLQDRSGQRVPDVSLRIRRNGEWASVTTDEIFAGRNVVVFSLPGAFTPTCSATHLPRFNELAPAFKV